MTSSKQTNDMGMAKTEPDIYLTLKNFRSSARAFVWSVLVFASEFTAVEDENSDIVAEFSSSAGCSDSRRFTTTSESSHFARYTLPKPPVPISSP